MSGACPFQIGTTIGMSKNDVDKAKTELENYMAETGKSRPNRGNLDDPSHKWIHAKPDYSKVL